MLEAVVRIRLTSHTLVRGTRILIEPRTGEWINVITEMIEVGGLKQLPMDSHASSVGLVILPSFSPDMTVKVTVNGHILAESDKTIQVEGNHYFPPYSVKTAELTLSSTQYAPGLCLSLTLMI